MFASIFAIIGSAAYEVGGLTEIWNIAEDFGRVDFFKYVFFKFFWQWRMLLPVPTVHSVNSVRFLQYSFQIDPTIRHTWWTLILGGMFTYISVYATNQVQVQRYLTMKDYDTVVKTLWFSWPITAFLSVSMCFSGLAIFSKYHDCDPIKLVAPSPGLSHTRLPYHHNLSFG